MGVYFALQSLTPQNNCLTQDAKDYLAGLGSVGISSIDRRSTLAMLTAKGVPKPAWFVEKYASRGNGPSIIKSSLEIF